MDTLRRLVAGVGLVAVSSGIGNRPMSDKSSNDTEDSPTDAQTESTTLTSTAVTSQYKVLGELDADDGVGVLGQNNAATGTSIGVQGAVPNNSTGYGLATPDDAQINGVAELGGVAGSLTGNIEVTNLTGNKLGIDGSGNLQWEGFYRTNTFSSAGDSWGVVSGLASQTPVEVSLDTNGQTSGRLRVLVDGAEAFLIGIDSDTATASNRMFGPSSSLSVESEAYYSFDATADVSNEDTFHVGLDFKSDGTKMFTNGFDNANVYEYTLSTAWDVTTRSFNQSYDFSSQETRPRTLRFKNDGTKMFIAGDNQVVYSYILSTAWDIGTASFSTSFDVSSETFPGALTFKDDGSKMYAGSSSLYVYDLSTAWDLDTASYSGTSKSFGPEVSDFVGIRFAQNGSRLFLSAANDLIVAEYRLSTAWDVTTAELAYLFDVSGTITDLEDIALRSDESALFAVNRGSKVAQYPESYGGQAFASVQLE